MQINFYPPELSRVLLLLSAVSFAFFLSICAFAFLKAYSVFLNRKSSVNFKKKTKRLLSERLTNLAFKEIERVVKDEIRLISLDRVSLFCDMVAHSNIDPMRKEFILRKVAESDNIKLWMSLLKILAFKWKRILVLEILSKTKGDAAFEYIKGFLNSADNDVAYKAASSLAEFNGIDYTGILLQKIGKHPYINGSRIATILEASKTLDKKALLNALQDSSEERRLWSAHLLKRFARDVDVSRELQKMLMDKNPEIRAASCDSLSGSGSESAATSIIPLLKDDYWFVRLHAAKSIGALHYEKAAAEIAALLKDTNWWVRYNARRSLEQLGHCGADELIKFLDNDDRFARNSALESLERIGELDYVVDGLKRKKECGASIYELFAKILRAEGYKYLAVKMSDPDPVIREAARKCLEKKDMPEQSPLTP